MIQNYIYETISYLIKQNCIIFISYNIISIDEISCDIISYHMSGGVNVFLNPFAVNKA